MARVTIAPVIYAQFRRMDGNYAVKMRVTFNRTSRYMTTSETASPSQLTRGLAIKDRALSDRLDELARKMRSAIEDLDMFTLDAMTVDDVIRYMKKRIGGDFRLDFVAFWREAIQSKPEGSRMNYTTALHSFTAFIASDSLDISKVTSRLMREYEDWLVARYGKGARAVTMYTAAVSHIHGLARRKYNSEESGDIRIRNPFEFYKPPKQKATRHRNVSVSVIQGMIDARASLSGRERRAVDAFLLSFALMGMNSPDLLSCEPPSDWVLVYFRQKTRDRRSDRAEMHVLIDERIRPLFMEWADDDGKHAFVYHRFHGNHRQMNWSLAKGLASYRERAGIPPKGLDFYSARHSWASLAYSAGIDKGTINDCLCHVDKDMRVTDIYIQKDWSVQWKANSRVLDLFDWSPLVHGCDEGGAE